MIRTPALVITAIAASLLLASCTPTTPTSGDSGPVVASTSATPSASASAAADTWSPCAGADLDNFASAVDGQVQMAPTAGSYPPYLPMPSCIAYTNQNGTIAEFLGATTDNFGTIEQAVIAAQGPPDTGGALSATVTIDDVWSSGGVTDLRFVTASDGFSVDRIEASSVVANYTPGG